MLRFKRYGRDASKLAIVLVVAALAACQSPTPAPAPVTKAEHQKIPIRTGVALNLGQKPAQVISTMGKAPDYNSSVAGGGFKNGAILAWNRLGVSALFNPEQRLEQVNFDSAKIGFPDFKPYDGDVFGIKLGDKLEKLKQQYGPELKQVSNRDYILIREALMLTIVLNAHDRVSSVWVRGF
jgi:hypothetical protein